LWFLASEGVATRSRVHSQEGGLHLFPGPAGATPPTWGRVTAGAPPGADRDTSDSYCGPVDDSRKIIGSWIEGPGSGTEQFGDDFGYRGRRLGLPEEGPGAIASTGRRLAAVLIDWWLCALISYELIARHNSVTASYWTMFIFFVLSVLTIGTVGRTPGKRLVGLRVVRLDGGRPTVAQVALRTFLLLLLIPGLVWDRDGRGLHDKAVATVEVRS